MITTIIILTFILLLCIRILMNDNSSEGTQELSLYFVYFYIIAAVHFIFYLVINYLP